MEARYGKEKNYKPYKPDFVFLHGCRTAAIYLGVTLLQHSICLPASIGRAALNRLPIGHFITQGLPFHSVATTERTLLPYIFTLTCYGGYFLWRYLYPGCPEPHPLGGALLCAVRTFLRSCTGTAAARVCSGGKGTVKYRDVRYEMWKMSIISHLISPISNTQY